MGHMNTCELLTTRQVVERLGIHPRTVHRLVQRGQLDAVRLPGYKGPLLFAPADVNALKEKRAGK